MDASKQCALQADQVPQRSERSTAEDEKARNIASACADPLDIRALIAYATSQYGLVDDEVRQRAWPILLDCPSAPKALDRRWQDLPPHRDEDQVQLDVNRSFVYYPKHETEQQLDERKRQLSDVILQLLREHQSLCYFQGFHDIVQVLLLVLGLRHARKAVVHLSLLRIRDFMLPSLAPSIAQLKLLPSIIYAVDPQLCRHLSSTQPFFALSATLTMYAHDIDRYGQIVRLFDFLIAQPAVVSVYFFAVIVWSRRAELLEIPASEPEMLHSVLSKLPKPLDLEALISRTVQVYNDHPPDLLAGWAWWNISSYSVMKTTLLPGHRQTVDDGQRMFAIQAKQLRREESRKRTTAAIWKHRRPAVRIGIALCVGLLSFWLRRKGMDGHVWVGLRKIWRLLQGSG